MSLPFVNVRVACMRHARCLVYLSDVIGVKNDVLCRTLLCFVVEEDENTFLSFIHIYIYI